jgi:hypothetical protein
VKRFVYNPCVYNDSYQRPKSEIRDIKTDKCIGTNDVSCRITIDMHNLIDILNEFEDRISKLESKQGGLIRFV